MGLCGFEDLTNEFALSCQDIQKIVDYHEVEYWDYMSEMADINKDPGDAQNLNDWLGY